MRGFKDVRIHPDRPIVGVGAVTLDGDRVVLIRRSHEPLRGEWSLLSAARSRTPQTPTPQSG